MMKAQLYNLSLILTFILIMTVPAKAERIKDITDVQGVRSNPLIGYGLVVGLDGSGDKTNQTPFTTQTFKNMLEQFGISVPPDLTPTLKNVAAVSIHGHLPAFAKPGQKIDITVSSIGNAASLRGGTLLMTPLKAADGQIYAIAQGDLVVGGFGVAGQDGSKVTVNIPSVGRIPNGAMVEKPSPNPFAHGDYIVLNLKQSDFTTASRVTDAINDMMGPNTALSLDATSIKVGAPTNLSQKVAYLSVIENIEIQPAKPAARIIINSRTGTIVIGQNVKLLPAAVSHGSLTVTIREDTEVSQPNGAFSSGRTVASAQSEIEVDNPDAYMFKIKGNVTLDDLVEGVNRIGMSPSDLMAILEALKQAGSLRAELIVI